ncbi:MAG: phosphotransferase [Prevotella sp.]|nr:phosphotransferase [Prevotella sp.]
MKTAVILTARKERDSEIPYPLLPFDGHTCLLDRTLQILAKSGYSKIIIVAGYRYELFERFRSSEVILVKNPDYSFTSSMASLAMAKECIDEDFLLIEGDTFYESYVLESLTNATSHNCFAITEESGSGDEAYVETKQGFITKISKDKHQLYRFEGELLGICKIGVEIYRKMISRWEQCSNPFMNYEYMMMDCTDALDRPFIMFKNLIWGDVDNQEDYLQLCNYTYRRLCRKENPFDYDNLLSYLEDVFPDSDVRSSVQIKQIGGMSNKNYKVSYDGNDYVLRVPGNGSSGMVTREYEEQNSILANGIGITPSMYYFNSKTGIKLSSYITDAETLNNATIQRKENLEKIAIIYKSLHGSNVRFNNDFNVFHEILKYESLLLSTGASMYDGYEYIRAEVFLLENRLNILGIELKPCHNDAVAENFIKSNDGTVYLIDWEYSGMNDPVWDIAALFLESDFCEESKDIFLHGYYGEQIPDNIDLKILIYQVLMDVLWSMWTVIKEKQGDDFSSYGMDRFSRAKKNLSLIKSFEE